MLREQIVPFLLGWFHLYSFSVDYWKYSKTDNPAKIEQQLKAGDDSWYFLKLHCVVSIVWDDKKLYTRQMVLNMNKWFCDQNSKVAGVIMRMNLNDFHFEWVQLQVFTFLHVILHTVWTVVETKIKMLKKVGIWKWILIKFVIRNDTNRLREKYKW